MNPEIGSTQEVLFRKCNEEGCLRKVNNALLLKIIKHPREEVCLSEDSIDDEQCVLEELLIKKILEYREIRNYTMEEKVNLEDNFRYLEGRCENGKGAATDQINNIQDTLMQLNITLQMPIPSFNSPYQLKLQFLIQKNISLLKQSCDAISNKVRNTIKLFWVDEKTNKKKNTMRMKLNYIEYENLLIKKKILVTQLSAKKRRINMKNKLLENIINDLEKQLVKKRCIMKTNNDIWNMILQTKKKKITEIVKSIEARKDESSAYREAVKQFKKKTGLLNHKHLLDDFHKVSENIIKLQNVLQ